MDRKEQVTIALGALTGVALLVLLVRSAWIGQPLSDRTLAIFAGLLYAYLNIDIGFGLTSLITPSNGGRNDSATDDDAKKKERG